MTYQCPILLQLLQHCTMIVLCIRPIDPTETTSSPTSAVDKHPYTEFCTHHISNTTNIKREEVDVCLCMYNCGPAWINTQDATVYYPIYDNEQTLCTPMMTASASRLEHLGNMYMVVDKCIAKQSCYHFKSAPWGSLYPVYSNATDTIYLNDQCSGCNNDTDVVPWQIEVNCPASSLLSTYISEGFTLAFHGALQQDSGCSFRFLPPEHVDLTHKLCFRVMDSYYLNTKRESTEYERLCSNLETAYQYIGKDVERISCISCSNVTDYIHNIMCDIRGGKRALFMPISFLLATNNVAVLSRETNKPNRNLVGGCNLNEIAERKTGQCRKVRCPEGQVQNAGDCKYVSAEWKAGPFVSFLRLEPLNKNDMLEMEHIGELFAYKGKFFKNHLKSWSRELYYYTPKNQTHVKYFVLKLMHRYGRVKPVSFFKNFEMSLKSPWSLSIAEKKYYYKASIHKYFRYFFCSNITKSGIKSGSIAIPAHFQSCFSAENENCEVLISVRDQEYVDRGLEIGLTTFFLCRHVDLNPTEFVVLDKQRIYFNVTDQILESAEFKLQQSMELDGTISVCISTFGNDFWQVANDGFRLTGKSLIVVYVYVLFFIANPDRVSFGISFK